MQIDEQTINDMIKALKLEADVSLWKKDRKASPLLTLMSGLNTVPRASVEPANFSRVRDQIMSRISTPVAETKPAWFSTKTMRLSIGAVGSLLIIASLALGTAVVALGSGPGDTIIYPLKKIVENIQLKLTPADQRISLQLKFADNRINEIQQVLENQQEGKVSKAEAQRAISQTIKDFQKTASAAAAGSANQPKVVNKLAALNSKLQSASIQSEGSVKIELEKALEATRISQQQAIKNIENAGLKVDNAQVIIDDSVTASGKLTAVSDLSASIGTAKFLLTKDTQYIGVKAEDLKIGIVVDIEGQIKDNKSYATKITLVTDTKTETP